MEREVDGMIVESMYWSCEVNMRLKSTLGERKGLDKVKLR